MIDTLKVFTDDFKISDNAGLLVQPAIVNYETGETKEYNLFRGANGKWVTGAKAYVNTGNYQLTIKPIIETQAERFCYSCKHRCLKSFTVKTIKR